MYRNSPNLLRQQSNRISSVSLHGYQHVEGGDLPTDNAGGDNGPRFSIPRKPVSGLSVVEPNAAHFETHKLEALALEDKAHHCSPPESSFPGLLRVWWLEILSCFLVIGASLAIVATVYPYRDRPLPQWPYNLSINSLISVYVVILKAAMLLILAQGKAFKLVAYRTGNSPASRPRTPQMVMVQTSPTTSRSRNL
jgi:hypothetical protein